MATCSVVVASRVFSILAGRGPPSSERRYAATVGSSGIRGSTAGTPGRAASWARVNSNASAVGVRASTSSTICSASLALPVAASAAARDGAQAGSMLAIGTEA